jgi:hypothetical protein
MGLGNQYPATGGGSYGAMFAVDRNSTTPYLSVRFNESNSFSSWYRVNSGNGTRAWVNFNGSNASIRASGNVSSISKFSTGGYTINFSSAMPDTNYASAALCRDETDDFPGMGAYRRLSNTNTTTAHSIETWYNDSQYDCPQVDFMVFR